MKHSNRWSDIVSKTGQQMSLWIRAGVRAARFWSLIRQVDLEIRRLQSQKTDRLLQIGLSVYDLYKSNDLEPAELARLAESVHQLDQSIAQREREIEAIRLGRNEAG